MDYDITVVGRVRLVIYRSERSRVHGGAERSTTSDIELLGGNGGPFDVPSVSGQPTFTIKLRAKQSI